MDRRALVVFATLGMVLFAPARLAAQAEVHFYQPHYFATVDEALSRLNFLAPNAAPMAQDGNLLTLTSGYSLEKVDVSKPGINLLFTKSGSVVDTQYFWSWRGGYNAPVTAQYKDDIVTTIPYDEISLFEIWAFPRAKGINTWCAKPVLNQNLRNDAVCLANEQDTQAWIDAVATLAVAARGKVFASAYGMTLGSVPEKELKKHPEQAGCQISGVALEGPPAQAGLRNNDILHTVNGKPCTPDAFNEALDEATIDKEHGIRPNGGVVHVEVYRKNQQASFDLHYPNPITGLDIHQLQQSAEALALKNMPSAQAPAQLPAAAPVPAPEGFHLGIAVRAVTDADTTLMRLTKARGIVVVDVEKDSMAAKMGLQPGDVILEVNNSEIGDVELFTQYVHGGAVKKFKVWRKGQSLDLVVPQNL